MPAVGFERKGGSGFSTAKNREWVRLEMVGSTPSTRGSLGCDDGVGGFPELLVELS